MSLLNPTISKRRREESLTCPLKIWENRDASPRLLFSKDRPCFRQVLDCASALALCPANFGTRSSMSPFGISSLTTRPQKAGRTAAVQNFAEFSGRPSEFGHSFYETAQRACLKTPPQRRVRARGLQESAKIFVLGRPGALTGRVFKPALSHPHHPKGLWFAGVGSDTNKAST